MPPKKNLYELLQLNESASAEDLRAAHDRLVGELEAQRNPHNGADTNFQIRTLDVAYTTLSSPSSRLAYDARLANEREAARIAGAPLRPRHRTPTWEEELPAEARAILHRSQGKPGSEGAPSGWFELLRTANSAVTRSLVLIGVLAVLGTLLQVIFFRSQIATTPPGEARLSAEEKAVLQEYYQTHGVRPASRADLDILEQERQQKEKARYETERKQQQDALAQRRFEEETRRLAEQVSANLRRTEEEAMNKALAKR